MINKLFGKENKSIFVSVLIFIEYLALFRFPDYFWNWLLLLIVTEIIALLWILKFKFRQEKIAHILTFFILPLFFLTGSTFFLSISQNLFIQTGIITLFIILNYFLLTALKNLKESSVSSNPPIFYKNIIVVTTLISVFLICSLIFNAYVFLKIPVFLLLALIFLSIALLTYFLFWQYTRFSKSSLIYIGTISLISTEIAGVLSFWSINYPATPPLKISFDYLGIPLASLIILIVYYCFWGLSYYIIIGKLTKKIVLEYVVITVGMLFVLISTAKWFSILR